VTAESASAVRRIWPPPSPRLPSIAMIPLVIATFRNALARSDHLAGRLASGEAQEVRPGRDRSSGGVPAIPADPAGVPVARRRSEDAHEPAARS